MKAYQAYGKQGQVTASTPRQAAERFFSKFPKARKCDVIEGEASNDGFFQIKLSLITSKKTPKWDEVTKAAVATLPDVPGAASDPQ